MKRLVYIWSRINGREKAQCLLSDMKSLNLTPETKGGVRRPEVKRPAAATAEH